MKNILDFQCEYKAAADNTGRFSGYASVFGVVDHGNDIVMPGAFTKFISEQKATGRPIQLWREHDKLRLVGVVDKFEEDNKGLLIEGELTRGVRDADESYLLMKAGALSGISYGYKTINPRRNAKGQRELHEVHLHEISLVARPMLDISRVENVKSISELVTVRDCEAYLRDELGITAAQTKSLISRIKASTEVQREVETYDVSRALAILESIKQ